MLQLHSVVGQAIEHFQIGMVNSDKLFTDNNIRPIDSHSGPGETFSWGPQTLLQGPSSEKIFDFSS